MSFNPPHGTPAYQLFLAEAQELYQQVEVGLAQLSGEPSLRTIQKVIREIQNIQQGAQSLELRDLVCLGAAIDLILHPDIEGTIQNSRQDSRQDSWETPELLQHFCEGLQLSLMAHHLSLNLLADTERQNLVLNSLLPKALESFEVTLTAALSPETRYQLLLQQTQCFQYWYHAHNIPELEPIATTTLKALQDAPQSDQAIASVALAGFQVAHRSALQHYSILIPPEKNPENFRSDGTEKDLHHAAFNPAEHSLTILNITQYLVGLAHCTVFCIATDSIAEIVLPQPDQQIYEAGTPQFLWNNYRLPLIQFTDLWKHCQPSHSATNQQTSGLILVLKHQSTPLALVLEFDRLIVDTHLELAQEENHTSSPAYRYGWTIMDGNWLEVVDVNTLLQEQFSRDHSWTIPTEETLQSASYLATLETSDLLWATADNLEPQTILIVDDSKTVREILSATLHEAGYDVLQAQNGQEAIAHLQQQTIIHLTICDIEMSNLNGFEFLRHRLQDERWFNIPVLILSSHTSPEYQQLAQKLGAADYCTIPYDPAILLDKIDRLLQNVG
jgi:CheY-like chemotaxis protein